MGCFIAQDAQIAAQPRGCGGARALVGAAAGAQAAAGSAERSLRSALAHGLGEIGGATGAYVVDLNTGQTLFAHDASTGRLPASVEKIYTTSTALLRFGPDATLATSVLGSGTISASGGLERHALPEGWRRPDVRLGRL